MALISEYPPVQSLDKQPSGYSCQTYFNIPRDNSSPFLKEGVSKSIRVATEVHCQTEEVVKEQSELVGKVNFSTTSPRK